jgi:sugar phosphate isomerase/epimerase
MKTIKGPGICLAQFAGDEAPYNTLEGLAAWAAGHGYVGIQIPTWDGRLFDLERAAESQEYCEEVKGIAAGAGIAVTELSTHLQGQLVASHPAFDTLLDAFAPAEIAGNAKARTAWAVEQLWLAAKASRNLGLKAHATFSGALVWPFVYPWPQRPAGLIDEAFKELGRGWMCALSCIRARICTTARPSTGFSVRSEIIRGPTFCTIRATWCCSKWIIWRSSISITSGCARFT